MATTQLAAADTAGTRFLRPPTARPASAPASPPASAPATGRRAAASWLATHVNLLRVTDSLLVIGAVGAGCQLSYVGFAPADPGDAGTVASAAVIAFLWLIGLEVYRTRDAKLLGIGADEFKRVTSATFRVFGLMGLAAVLFSLHGATAFVTVSLPLGLLGLTANRWAFRRRLTAQKARGRCLSRALVVGDPDDVRYVVQQVLRKSGPVYQILGVCLPGARRGASLRVDGRAIPVLCSTDDIARTVRLAEADSVIIAGPLPGGNRFIRELGWRLEESSTELILAATLTNVAGPRIHWRPVEGLPLMHVDIPQYTGAKHAMKRVMDVGMALLALLVLSPLLVVLAVIVRLDSPGPVFFRQDRVGRDGQAFGMLKFRSMVVDAEARLATLGAQNEGAGVLFKMRDDPRVTRCGRWMRKYSLDELPQLWNVARGDMSLVGPRPPLAREVSGYERHTHRRLLIKPGITGLWQINGRSDLPWDEAVRLDLYYVENWSIAGDLLILWRTFRAVVRPSGAY
ncbi:exopolysaccharide biosynthesis polyprenyl glycosylphosphotransferase [Pseudarthrobacter chlorophenolicus A6]|uniref:Exopolysaccharide biosynthesis polyprenyl glycosylphosphotransferase n=1 Tax=Pseudarthrobacter chlorophenolicus (strain ATCC 700700 / DSM 12829 / CIP 107037 / JCM 12360 / KCTC 9906 / NCIMB 13794 / A6) TaxID=452863 RepID=B8H844_PSECP|nr:exopolysaccharide biosynthesis polyprenyl glycosylphosphotransferase [Pseudarthrobacter chlorophenolicus A6]SDQ57512.1 exopolysaccharide biosynthesis polyprenyl glycosylphosphotransferase [Pseudarthrobacter chlorophenolicus]